MNKKKTAVQTYVQLFSGNVELSIAVTEKLKREKGNLEGFGHIAVSSGEIDKDECLWDNLAFFNGISAKKFRKDCKKELEEKGFSITETHKDIKKLMKRAKKLKILR